MPAIPTEALPAAEFIVRHLYRPLEVADETRFFAVTETEHLVGGDNWFWLDDNAKVLEFMSRPEVWRRFPEQTLEMLRFVRWMCQGPFMFRRVSTPRLERTGGEGEGLMTGAQHVHSLMHVRRDLRQGMVAVGVRFHDVRTADNLLLSGNRSRFTHRGRRYRVDVEDAIADVDAREQGHTLTLRHSSELFFTPRSAAAAARPHQLCLHVRRARDAVRRRGGAGSRSRRRRRRCRADDRPRPSEPRPQRCPLQHAWRPRCPGRRRVSFTAAASPGMRRIAAAGASYYSIAQAEIAGFALAIHTAPRQPERLAELEVHVLQPGRLHLVRASLPLPRAVPRRAARRSARTSC